MENNIVPFLGFGLGPLFLVKVMNIWWKKKKGKKLAGTVRLPKS